MLNKILKFFGLMTIERAAYISRTIHIAYEKYIGAEAQKKFGAEIKPDLVDDAGKWADQAFYGILLTDMSFVDLIIRDEGFTVSDKS